MACSDSRNAVLLDGSRDLVLGQVDILGHSWVETSVLEPGDRCDTNRSLLLKVNRRNPAKLSATFDRRWRDKRNPLGEVDALRQLTALRGTEELSLELRKLRAEVSLLAIPVIDRSITVKLSTTGGILSVIILLGLDPAIGGTITGRGSGHSTGINRVRNGDIVVGQSSRQVLSVESSGLWLLGSRSWVGSSVPVRRDTVGLPTRVRSGLGVPTRHFDRLKYGVSDQGRDRLPMPFNTVVSERSRRDAGKQICLVLDVLGWE